MLRVGISQSVERLATGWTVRGSNPGEGDISPHLYGPALGLSLQGAFIQKTSYLGTRDQTELSVPNATTLTVNSEYARAVLQYQLKQCVTWLQLTVRVLVLQSLDV